MPMIPGMEYGPPGGGMGYGDPSGGGSVGAGMSAGQKLRTAIQYAESALQDEPDDESSQMISQAVNIMYRLVAGRQKEREAAEGTTPALKFMKRQYGG